MKKKAFSLCPVKVINNIAMKIELEVELGDTYAGFKWFQHRYNKRKVRGTFVSKILTFSQILALATHGLAGAAYLKIMKNYEKINFQQIVVGHLGCVPTRLKPLPE